MTVERLLDIESEWEKFAGVNPSAELLRVYLLLSSIRPTGMGPSRIPLSDMLAALELTWLDPPKSTWVQWITTLDAVYMADQVKRAKIRSAKAKAEAKKRKR